MAGGFVLHDPRLRGIAVGQGETQDTVKPVEKIREYYSYIKVSPLQSIFSQRNITESASDGGANGASLGLGLLIAMVTAALAIAIIALLISKMRRRQSSDSTDIDLEVPTDPYMQAIMFPTEPRPEWHRHLRQVINKAGQKIFKKGEPHETTIPENLRHQLKHIYVY
ncbi:uncharacterized protein LOC123506899 isoform X3 [Portunus trituberculatus]|uniref:uncharacterized protein LOC123506899 isoform X3 n=1 Tax=Portunus trituberculatus TaxID=210409 RepID=UPI001E1D1795|nr:uncharacterized protein LOC123506899 isoform X3 [Portunus trituberculatus]